MCARRARAPFFTIEELIEMKSPFRGDPLQGPAPPPSQLGPELARANSGPPLRLLNKYFYPPTADWTVNWPRQGGVL